MRTAEKMLEAAKRLRPGADASYIGGKIVLGDGARPITDRELSNTLQQIDAEAGTKSDAMAVLDALGDPLDIIIAELKARGPDGTQDFTDLAAAVANVKVFNRRKPT